MNPEEIQQRSAFYHGGPREQRTCPTAAAGIAVPVLQAREMPNGGLNLVGYASVTNVPYVVTDWLGDYNETISRGAFKKSLAEQDDVRLLLNHDGIPLARTASGTMNLSEDSTGLLTEASLDAGSPFVASIRSAMERGDLNQMSFAFKVTRQEWDEDYLNRYINEVRLFDTSVVTYPASPTTSVGLRGDDESWPTADDLEKIAATERAERIARQAARQRYFRSH